jgi:uncharacterized OsmC-like protein
MSLRGFVKIGVIALLSPMLMAGVASCEKKDYRFVLEKMPAHYRQCAEKVVKIPEGPLTYTQLLDLTIKLRQSEKTQNRCLKGAIEWADAQWNAYHSMNIY